MIQQPNKRARLRNCPEHASAGPEKSDAAPCIHPAEFNHLLVGGEHAEHEPPRVFSDEFDFLVVFKEPIHCISNVFVGDVRVHPLACFRQTPKRGVRKMRDNGQQTIQREVHRGA